MSTSWRKAQIVLVIVACVLIVWARSVPDQHEVSSSIPQPGEAAPVSMRGAHTLREVGSGPRSFRLYYNEDDLTFMRSVTFEGPRRVKIYTREQSPVTLEVHEFDWVYSTSFELVLAAAESAEVFYLLGLSRQDIPVIERWTIPSVQGAYAEIPGPDVGHHIVGGTFLEPLQRQPLYPPVIEREQVWSGQELGVIWDIGIHPKGDGMILITERAGERRLERIPLPPVDGAAVQVLFHETQLPLLDLMDSISIMQRNVDGGVSLLLGSQDTSPETVFDLILVHDADFDGVFESFEHTLLLDYDWNAYTLLY